MKFHLFWILFFPLLSCLSYAQSVLIETTEGEEYRGVITEERGDTITLQSTDGSYVQVPRSSIRLIDYTYGSERTKSNRGFWMLGAAIGTPTGINIIVGGNFNRRWGLRLSGANTAGFRGGQVEGLWNIGRSGIFSHNVHFGGGSVRIMNDIAELSWDYLTVGYDLNLSGFFVSVGLSVGSGEDMSGPEVKRIKNPQPLGQIGYVLELR